MEWYKNQFMEDVSFSDINEGILKDPHRIPPVFLPYLTGINAPDFNENAVAQCVSMKKRYEPVKKDADDNTYQVFTELYDSLKDVYRLNRQKHS